MAEQYDLDVPQGGVAATNNWKVRIILLDLDAQLILVGLLGENGIQKNIKWTGQPATDLIIALNKANLPVISLQKRVLNQAETDGKLTSGSVSGTPD